MEAIKYIFGVAMIIFFLACEKDNSNPPDTDCTECPEVIGLLPDNGLPGDRIKIYGKKLTGTTKVLFDNSEAQFEANGDTLEVIVPQKGSKDTVSISVRASVGANVLSNNVKPKFIYKNSFFSGFAPQAQRHSELISLSGFFDVAQIEKVTINSKDAIISNKSTTELSVIVPRNCGSGDVKILLNNGIVLSTAKRFVYSFQKVNTSELVTNVELSNPYMEMNASGHILYAGNLSQSSNNKRILIYDSKNRTLDNAPKLIYDLPINFNNPADNFNFNHVTSIGDKFYILTYDLGVGGRFSIREVNNGIISNIHSFVPSADYLPISLSGHNSFLYIGSFRNNANLPNTTLTQFNLSDKKISVVNPNISPIYMAVTKAGLVYFINNSAGVNPSSTLQSYNILTKEVKQNLAPPLGTAFFSSIALNRYSENPEILIFQNTNTRSVYVYDIPSGNLDEIEVGFKFKNLAIDTGNQIFGLTVENKLVEIKLE